MTIAPFQAIELQKLRGRMAWAAAGCSAGVLWMSPATIAQVVPDTTLTPSVNLTDRNSTINTTAIVGGNPAVLIEGGATRSSNLFHSFQEFNIQAGERVYFANPTGIESILTRVTGGAASNIFGTLGVDGSADLFLLNPNGIVFGENAQLDINGSFVSATAESVDFGSGDFFSATSPQPVTPLSVSVPIGLQYGSAAGITIEGPGSRVFFDPGAEVTDKSFRANGLEVPTDQTLALLGGGVRLEGGNLTSASGNVEVAAVELGYLPLQDGTAGYLPFQLLNGVPTVDLPTSTVLGNILATNGASIAVSGDPSGNVRLLADTIEFNAGAGVFMDTLGAVNGGSLQAFAPGAVVLRDFGSTGIDPFYSSSWSTLVPTGRTGKGADVAINTGHLQILNGASLLTETNGAGDAGNVTIKAEEVTIAEINPFMIISTFGSYVGVEADGNGGNLTIDTERLTLADASVTGVQTRGNGDSGDVKITATDFVEIDTQLPDFVPFPLLTRLSSEAAPITVLGTSAPPAGDAGNISIETPSLRVLNGSQLRTSNSGTGDGGDINVVADRVEVDGTGETFTGFVSFSPLVVNTEEIPSLISATIGDPGTGNAGDITLTVDRLLASNGGLVSNSSLGNGAGGIVEIIADEQVELVGTNADGAIASGIYSRAVSGNGSGGDISLMTPQLSLRDGATVNVSNFDSLGTRAAGTGPAGNINIEATTLQLSNAATLNANTLSGQRGNISLQATDLTLSQDSRISTNADGTGSGGNLQVTADNVSLLSNSELLANANGTGDAGDISVNADRRLYLNQSQITASGGQGNIRLASPVVLLRDNSLVATDAKGTAVGGNILMDADFLIALEDSDITANAELSSGGRVVVNAQSIIGTDFRLHLTAQSDITASSDLGPDLNGTVELNTLDTDVTQGLVALDSALADSNNNVAQACGDQLEAGSFVASGRGGIPEDPSQLLIGTDPWIDFRSIYSETTGAPVEEGELSMRHQTGQSHSGAAEVGKTVTRSIVEAQLMSVDGEQVALLASATTPPSDHSYFCSKSS